MNHTVIGQTPEKQKRRRAVLPRTNTNTNTHIAKPLLCYLLIINGYFHVTMFTVKLAQGDTLTQQKLQNSNFYDQTVIIYWPQNKLQSHYRVRNRHTHTSVKGCSSKPMNGKIKNHCPRVFSFCQHKNKKGCFVQWKIAGSEVMMLEEEIDKSRLCL